MLEKISKLGTALSKKSQKNILGGAIGGGASHFFCYCGFVGGSGEDYPFLVVASSLKDALKAAGSECSGLGATCEG